MIKRLGSASFKERNLATEWLRERPEVEPALRKALLSADLEKRRRIENLLEHFEQQIVRDLHTAVKDGDVPRFIDLLANWPHGKYEPEAWAALQQMTREILVRHEKQGGHKIDLTFQNTALLPFVYSGKRVEGIIPSRPVIDGKRIETARPNDGYGRDVVRAGHVSLQDGSLPIIVASGSVRANCRISDAAVFVHGSFEGPTVHRTLILSCGNVVIRDLLESIVIARGRVQCENIIASRVISGERVLRNRERRDHSQIEENQPRPLAFLNLGKSKSLND